MVLVSLCFPDRLLDLLFLMKFTCKKCYKSIDFKSISCVFPPPNYFCLFPYQNPFLRFSRVQSWKDELDWIQVQAICLRHYLGMIYQLCRHLIYLFLNYCTHGYLKYSFGFCPSPMSRSFPLVYSAAGRYIA